LELLTTRLGRLADAPLSALNRLRRPPVTHLPASAGKGSVPALGLDLPNVKLFQHPTIRALAGFLSQREAAPGDRVRDRGRRKQAAFARGAKTEHEVVA